jgi:hypothetical protein
MFLQIVSGSGFEIGDLLFEILEPVIAGSLLSVGITV